MRWVVYLVGLLVLVGFVNAFTIEVKPLVGGSVVPNSTWVYEFNFTTDIGCSSVLLTHSDTVSVGGDGVGYTVVNLSGLESVPSFVCEYRNDSLRAVHNVSSVVFDKVLSKRVVVSENVSVGGNLSVNRMMPQSGGVQTINDYVQVYAVSGGLHSMCLMGVINSTYSSECSHPVEIVSDGNIIQNPFYTVTRNSLSENAGFAFGRVGVADDYDFLIKSDAGFSDGLDLAIIDWNAIRYLWYYAQTYGTMSYNMPFSGTPDTNFKHDFRGDAGFDNVTVDTVLKLVPRSAAPASPSAGWVYVDSDSNDLCFYNGTNWRGAFSGACA